MLFDGFGPRRVKLDMVAPARDVRLVVGDSALRSRDFDNKLNTAPQPGRRFMFVAGPQRAQDAQNVAGGLPAIERDRSAPASSVSRITVDYFDVSIRR